MKLLLLGLFALGCTDTSTDSSTAIPVDPRTNGMLEAHNLVRANASPDPSPALEPMTWAADLAQAAAEYASTCTWEHDPALDALEQGENLAAWSAANFGTGEMAVESWAAEAAFYNYSDGSCQAGQQCGHYTQIVWRTSVEVGCAVGDCPDGLQGWDAGVEIWVCRYRERGNLVGAKPY